MIDPWASCVGGSGGGEGAYYSNNENEVIAESDDMRFFIDLERPYADFSIIQNPLYPELYELYMLTNEEVFIEGSKLYVNQIPRNLESFANEDNPDHSTFFYYVSEFGEEGNYEQIYVWVHRLHIHRKYNFRK